MLSKVKVLLGISDDLQDDLLVTIQELTLAHFMAYTGFSSVPTELEFILVEIMVKRFNRIGAEGFSSKSVEGASVSFSSRDFSDYDVFLNQYSNKSFIRFL